MDIKEQKSIIEGLLFTWGDPLSVRDISRILELKKKETEEILNDMIGEFNYERRGLQILKVKDTYQIGTRPEHFKWIKELAVPKESRSLSGAALETLSIIAYKQPIIKSEIEAIRGVKCDKAISTLMDKNLVAEAGRLEKTGRPLLYKTTNDFLKAFGLDSLKELPEIDKDLKAEENNDKINEEY